MRRLPTSLAQPLCKDSPSAVPQTQGGSCSLFIVTADKPAGMHHTSLPTEMAPGHEWQAPAATQELCRCPCWLARWRPGCKPWAPQPSVLWPGRERAQTRFMKLIRATLWWEVYSCWLGCRGYGWSQHLFQCSPRVCLTFGRPRTVLNKTRRKKQSGTYEKHSRCH